MNNYPDCETYKALYKRFYDGRSPEELINLAGDIKGKTVIDLCAGDGRLSLKVAQLGALRVDLIEQEEKMISEEVWDKAFGRPYLIIPITLPIEKVLLAFAKRFDLAFCQQGVNYWLNRNTARLVGDVLKKDGVFIFNTFHQKPSEKPMVKEYELDGKKFAEISWLIGNTVHHVQIREGMRPHATEFQWLSPEYLEKILFPHFEIEIKNEGASALYRCSRK